MKRYDQSKKAKEEFMKNNILTLIMPDPDRSYTREELRHTLDTSDRKLRKEMAELANYQAVISPSSGKGYRLLRITNDTSTKKLKEYLELIEHQVAENRSRVTNINARMKPLIALKVEIEMMLSIQEAKKEEG